MQEKSLHQQKSTEFYVDPENPHLKCFTTDQLSKGWKEEITKSEMKMCTGNFHSYD